MTVDPQTMHAKNRVAHIAFVIYILILTVADLTICLGIRSEFDESVSIAIIAAIDLISFMSLYAIIDYIYDKVIFRYFLKIDNLSGRWYQFHVPNDYNLSKFRFGVCKVEHEYYHVNISGENRGVTITVDASAFNNLDSKGEKTEAGSETSISKSPGSKGDKHEKGSDISLSDYMDKACSVLEGRFTEVEKKLSDLNKEKKGGYTSVRAEEKADIAKTMAEWRKMSLFDESSGSAFSQ